MKVEAQRAIADIRDLSRFSGEYDVNGSRVLNCFHPDRIEVGPFLDPEHIPAVTKFETVALLPDHWKLRRQDPNVPTHATELPGDGRLLRIISAVASRPTSYTPTPEGRLARTHYSNAMRELMKGFYGRLRHHLSLDEFMFVPVRRAGENVARMIDMPGTVIEGKRLRIKGAPDLLAAGINLGPEARHFHGMRLRVVEGVVASGSTLVSLILGLKNRGIFPQQIDTDSAILCTAGANYLEQLREATNVQGRDYGAFVGGTLDSDWYVRYGSNDPLLRYLGPDAPSFVGYQVLGDGGDLTSNL